MGKMTAEEAAEAAKGLTFEKVWMAFMESDERMEKQKKETEEWMKQQKKETDERMEKQKKETDERMEKQKKETEEWMKQQKKEMDEWLKKSMDEFQKKLDKTMNNLSLQVGKVSNSVGDMAEAMFSGDLSEKLEVYGIKSTMQTPNRKFKIKGDVVAEADIYIENGLYVIPVEIKTRLTEKDVKKYLFRMGAIRRSLDADGDRRVLLGAMAGGVVKSEALKFAHGEGLFVMVQSGESVTIAETPDGFKAREW